MNLHARSNRTGAEARCLAAERPGCLWGQRTKVRFAAGRFNTVGPGARVVLRAPLRLDVVTVKRGDTVDSLVKRMALNEDPEGLFRLEQDPTYNASSGLVHVPVLGLRDHPHRV